MLGSEGRSTIVVSGAVASVIVHAKLAGVASTLPAPSIARTANVCGPTARPAYSCGEAHDANAAPSSEHSNSESISFDLNVTVALVAEVVACGLSRSVVSGGTATVHTYSTGVSSAIPYVLSFAVTVNVC